MKIITTLVSFLLLLNLSAQTKPLDNPKLFGIREQLVKKIDSNLVSSISVGVSIKGKVIWKESFGWADKKNRIKATPETVYALGSLSKSITATGIFALLSEGRLSLADQVILNHNHSQTKAPTVEQLLAMEGGVPHFFRYVDTRSATHNPERDFQEFGITVFEPGKFHQYSNMSYGLLFNLMEEKSKRPAPDFLKIAVFDELGMNNSHCHLDYIGQKGNLAVAYDHQVSTLNHTQFEPIGGGGFYSTVSDLLKYGDFHLTNKNLEGDTLFEEAVFQKLHQPLKGQKHKWYANEWGTLDYAKGKKAYLSNGAIAGAATTLLIEPNEDLVVVCLTNNSVGNNFTDQIAFQITDAIVAEFMSGIHELFSRVEADFAPTEYTSTADEKGTWLGDLLVEGNKVPIVIAVLNDGKISFQERGKEEIPLANISRQHDGTVSASLEGVVQLGKKSMEGHSVSLTMDFGKEKTTGVLMLVSNENQPDGLPYYLEVTRK